MGTRGGTLTRQNPEDLWCMTRGYTGIYPCGYGYGTVFQYPREYPCHCLGILKCISTSNAVGVCTTFRYLKVFLNEQIDNMRSGHVFQKAGKGNKTAICQPKVWNGNRGILMTGDDISKRNLKVLGDSGLVLAPKKRINHFTDYFDTLWPITAII